jgi:hypothetical protein
VRLPLRLRSASAICEVTVGVQFSGEQQNHRTERHTKTGQSSVPLLEHTCEFVCESDVCVCSLVHQQGFTQNWNSADEFAIYKGKKGKREKKEKVGKVVFLVVLNAYKTAKKENSPTSPYLPYLSLLEPYNPL